MKKLTMDLDALRVDTFAASPDGVHAFGTVLGRERAQAQFGHVDAPTQDDSNCPILSCGCSAGGQRFTECDCEPSAPVTVVAGIGA